MTPCDEWRKNPLKNPRTKRPIVAGKATYNALVAECGSPTEAQPVSRSSPCAKWHQRPNNNPRSGKFIQTGKGVYNALLKECGPAPMRALSPPRKKPSPKKPSPKKPSPKKPSAKKPSPKKPSPKKPSPKKPSPKKPSPKKPSSKRKSPVRGPTQAEWEDAHRRIAEMQVYSATRDAFDSDMLPVDLLAPDELDELAEYEGEHGEMLGKEVTALGLYSILKERLNRALQKLIGSTVPLKRGSSVDSKTAATVLLAGIFYKAECGIFCLKPKAAGEEAERIAKKFLSPSAYAKVHWMLLCEEMADFIDSCQFLLEEPQVAIVTGDENVVVLKPLIERFSGFWPVGFRIPGWSRMSEKNLVKAIRSQYREHDLVQGGLVF